MTLPALPPQNSEDWYPHYMGLHNAADEVVNGRLSSGTLAATYVPHLDLVSDLRSPFYISHRGGPLRFPEHSMEGYRASAAAGFPVEPDVQLTSDGVAVCLHDATVDRTMTGATGNVASLTFEQFMAARVRPARPGFRTALPATWDQVLTELGGKILLVPEIKAPSAATAVIDSIAARGLHRACIIQSFNYAHAQAAAAAGIAAMWVSDAATSTDLDNMIADGIEFLGCSTAVSAGYVGAVKARGLRVAIYTVRDAVSSAAQFAKGADGIWADDAWALTGAYVPRDADPYADGTVWPGLTLGWAWNTFPSALTLRGRELGVEAHRSGGTNTFTVRQTWAGAERTGTLRVRGHLRFDTGATDSSRWGSLFLGALPGIDAYFKDGIAVAGQYGYHFLIRRSGVIAIYRINDNASGPTTLSTLGSPAAPIAADGAGGEVDFEVFIDATNVTLRNLTSGESVTAADTTHRGPWTLSLQGNNANAYWSNLTLAGV